MADPEFERQALDHLDALYNFAVYLTRRPADAEDLVQETFLRVFKAREAFDAQRPFNPWLYGIAAHIWADYGRARGSARAIVTRAAQAWGEPEATELNDVAEQVTRRDIAQHVQDAVHQLGEEHRLALILRHYHGLSYADVSQALGISVGTVKSRIHYALTRLRAGLRRRGVLEG